MDRILIIEDEPELASFIKKGLELNAYEVEVAENGETGLEKAFSKPFDLIILDINLPSISGYEVCRKIRENNQNIGILMLTALNSTYDKVYGFNLGANDYLVKPFDFEELLVRSKSLIRLLKRDSGSENILSVSDLELDLNSKTVKRSGNEIKLTAKEFSLLEYLLRNKGKVLSRTDIAEKIWDLTFDTGTNVIDLYIYYLRNKIDKNYPNKLIHTLYGMGYVIKETKD